MKEKLFNSNVQELFDWKKPLNPTQKNELKNTIDPLAENLEELAQFIETADDFIKSDDTHWFSGVAFCGNGDYEVSGHGGYSTDTLLWVVESLLSAKRLRPELEKRLGEVAAENFYQHLITAFHLSIGEHDLYLVPPEAPVVPERQNPLAELLAAKIDPKTGFEFLLGQVLYNGCDLNIKSRLKRELFETLHESIGRVVSIEVQRKKATKAIHYISELNKLFKAENIPFHIHTITGEGYKLERS